MNQKIVSFFLAASFLLLPFTYFVEGNEEEDEDFPVCSWNNPCVINVVDGDLDDPETEIDESGSNLGINLLDP